MPPHGFDREEIIPDPATGGTIILRLKGPSWTKVICSYLGRVTDLATFFNIDGPESALRDFEEECDQHRMRLLPDD
jgi:hypothetical protein